MNQLKLYIDMDGTLAEWLLDGFPCLYNKGYFYNLKPLNAVRRMLKVLCRSYDVYILSAVLEDSPYAKPEKLAWLQRYLPFIEKDHILFNKNGSSKAEFVKEFGHFGPHCILIDDYSVNLDDWTAKGGTSVKFLNGINASHGRNYQFCLKEDDNVIVNLSKMEQVFQYAGSSIL